MSYKNKMGTSLTKLETYSNQKLLFVIVSCNETNINNITVKENNTNALDLPSSIYVEIKEGKVNKAIKYAIHVLVFPIKYNQLLISNSKHKKMKQLILFQIQLLLILQEIISCIKHHLNLKVNKTKSYLNIK